VPEVVDGVHVLADQRLSCCAALWCRPKSCLYASQIEIAERCLSWSGGFALLGSCIAAAVARSFA
jgi:hypothetical protein